MRYGFWPVAAAVVLLLIGGSLLLTRVIDLAHSNREAIQRSQQAIATSRALDCRIGGFLVGFPVVKQPGTSEADFERGVQKAIDFLHALRAEDCNGLGRVTAAKINAQTHALKKVVGGGDGSTGNSPGSLPGGGPSSAPPPPPPVTPPTTPARPPTSTTTPTTPMPPNVVHRLICMLNRLGIKVCVRR